ncbi:MAG: heat-inducible transcriptional repressor HrcA [Actinomycetota bacterium]|nr:heat-inducible transcriptional repressor HrcA [Actinomycetota bacterium]
MAPRELPLEERRAEVLKAIVSQYVRSGEPVGSKTIAEQFGLGVSPATVRNDMAALEEAGYISQPHTSAGRVPTDAGYRYFVNTWARDVRLPADEERLVHRFFGEPRWPLEDALQRTASLLSRLTHHAAVVFAPALGFGTLRHLELVGLSQGRAMLVLVTDAGHVKNLALAIPESLGDERLAEASGLLNAAVAGIALPKAGKTLEQALERFPPDLHDVAVAVAEALTTELVERGAERVFLEGTSNIVDEEKFADLETVRQVIEALEHRRLLLEVLADAFSLGRVSVKIGSENRIEEMHLCAVITAPYGRSDSVIGSLGVVGPTRMDYGRTIAAVHQVAQNLGHMLSGLTGN